MTNIQLVDAHKQAIVSPSIVVFSVGFPFSLNER